MRLYPPDSESAASIWTLIEHNPCHQPGGRPDGGQFAPKGQGDCAGAQAEFAGLKAEWARVNESLSNLMHHPSNHPEVREKMQALKKIVKRMFRLKADPGTVEGIGLPGGPRDLVIVGAGPGGLSAATMAGTENLDTLLVEADTKVGGQAKYSTRIENFLGFPVGASGQQLAERWFEQAQRLGVEAQLGTRVVKLEYDPESEIKTLTLSNGKKIQARAVVIAGGVQFRHMDNMPNNPNVVYGDAERLAFLAGKDPVIIIGGSNGAAQAAAGLAKTSRHVTLLSRSPLTKSMSAINRTALENNPKISVVYDSFSELITERGKITGIVTKDGARLNGKAIGVFIGSAPDTDWIHPSIKRTDKGLIQTNRDFETDIPGVYAVGDVRDGSALRIGAAVGEGAASVGHIFKYYDRLKASDYYKRLRKKEGGG